GHPRPPNPTTEPRTRSSHVIQEKHDRTFTPECSDRAPGDLPAARVHRPLGGRPARRTPLGPPAAPTARERARPPRPRPRAGAWLAERLWFRLPPRPRESARARRAPVGGRELVVTWEDLAVRGVAYGPEDAPTAYLVHGWGGWWQQLASIVQPLVEAGYRVVA